MVLGSTHALIGEFVLLTDRCHDLLITKFMPINTDFHNYSKCKPINALDTSDFVFVRVNCWRQ